MERDVRLDYMCVLGKSSSNKAWDKFLWTLACIGHEWKYTNICPHTLVWHCKLQVDPYGSQHPCLFYAFLKLFLKVFHNDQVTVVFNRTEELNNNFNPDTNLIGIRIPDHDFLRQALDVVIKVLQLCRKVAFFFEAQKYPGDYKWS